MNFHLNIANHMPSYMQIKSLTASSVPLIYSVQMKAPITAFKNENDIVILQPKEIYMVRVENKDTIIYGKEHRYRSRKRLYEMQQQLGAGFMQISKSTLVNLSYMSNVEAGFSGTLLLKLKNGCKDYVSRKYLPEFKKYLGL